MVCNEGEMVDNVHTCSLTTTKATGMSCDKATLVQALQISAYSCFRR